MTILHRRDGEHQIAAWAVRSRRPTTVFPVVEEDQCFECQWETSSTVAGTELGVQTVVVTVVVAAAAVGPTVAAAVEKVRVAVVDVVEPAVGHPQWGPLTS